MIFSWWLISFGVLGALLGSFTTMLIHRLHFDLPGIISGRSECPDCHHRLSWQDLIPIFSWLFFRGKCQYCKKSISSTYVLIELSFVFVFIWFSAEFFPVLVAPKFIFLLIFAVFALVLGWYDGKWFEVDRRISWPAIGLAFVWTLFQENSAEFFIGGLVGFGFYFFQWLVSRGRWVGAGDQELGLFIGLVLGWQQTLLCFFGAYLLGSLIAVPLLCTQKIRGKSILPMGAFLMPSFIVFLLYGEKIWDFYSVWMGF